MNLLSMPLLLALIVDCHYTGKGWNGQQVSGRVLLTRESKGELQITLQTDAGEKLPLDDKAVMTEIPSLDEDAMKSLRYRLGESVDGLKASELSKLELYQQKSRDLPFEIFRFLDLKGQVARVVFSADGGALGAFICK